MISTVYQTIDIQPSSGLTRTRPTNKTRVEDKLTRSQFM